MFKSSVFQIMTLLTNCIQDLSSETCKGEPLPVIAERDIMHKLHFKLLKNICVADISHCNMC